MKCRSKALCLALAGWILLCGCTSPPATPAPPRPVSVDELNPPAGTEPEQPPDSVTYAEALVEITALLDDTVADSADFAETYDLTALLEDMEDDAVLSCRDAAVLLYNALTRAPHDLPLEVVALDRWAEGLEAGDEARRCVLFLYRWGILTGEEPVDWTAPISRVDFDTMLTRLQAPELRAELMPDLPTQVLQKLREAFRCACVLDCPEETLELARSGFHDLLLGLEDLEPMLRQSYWFLEQDPARVFYLTMFTAIDNTISMTRCSYDPEVDRAAVLETEAPVSCNPDQPDSDIAAALVSSVCLKPDLRAQWVQKQLPTFLALFREKPEDFSPLAGQFCVGYLSPRWEEPSLQLLGLRDGSLNNLTVLENSDGSVWYFSDTLTPSWYHLYD